MTNEERETLIAQSWTPPVAVDPDVNMARDYAHYLLGTIFEIPSFQRAQDHFFSAIKQGRALAAAEAKPKLVWVKFDFVPAKRHPVESRQFVCAKYQNGAFDTDVGVNIYWPNVTHYAIITQPEDAV